MCFHYTVQKFAIISEIIVPSAAFLSVLGWRHAQLGALTVLTLKRAHVAARNREEEE